MIRVTSPEGMRGSFLGGHGCWIAEDAWVGPDTEIWPGVYIGPRVRIGARCRVLPNATIGSPGFGYRQQDDGSWETHPHTGGVELGDDVHVGANACVDAGTVDPTRIGRGSKIDNLVHIAHNAQIGEDVLIVAQSLIAGSTHVRNGAYIGAGAIVREHRVVGAGAFVAMGAVVVADVPPGVTAIGVPARARA